MSQLRSSRSFLTSDEFDDDLAVEYLGWPRVERTCAAIAGPVEEAARLHIYVSHTKVPSAWTAIRAVPVVDRFSAGTFVLHLTDENFSVELERMSLVAGSGAVGTASDQSELGSPKVDVLLGAVNDLSEWTGMTKQALSKYLGVSYSTVLSWRRERPERPRHPGIPAVLALWAAISGAREEFGVEDAARMVWASGKSADGLPALGVDELAAWLVEKSSEANLSEFLAEDGYVAGSAPPLNVDELAAAEGELHVALERPLSESDHPAGR